jgi:hypothetical protein
MANERISLNDSGMDVLVKMAGGNPGALTVMMGLLKEAEKIDPMNIMGGMGVILSLDTLHIYEERIWMLYKDVCGEDLVKMCAVLRGWQLGMLDESSLNRAIDNNGEGVDINKLHKKVVERIDKFSTEGLKTE